MAQFPNIFNCDLHSGPVSASIRQMYLGDIAANRVGVRVTDNGEAVALSGTCSGTAMLYNGGTVALTGVVDGNVAYVDLPAAVYSVEGPLKVFVTLTHGGSTTTLLEMRSNVTRTESGVVIDPGTIIPSVAALISDIEDAVASIPEDYSELSADVAQLKSDMEDVQPAVETLEDDVSSLKSATNYIYNGAKYTLDPNDVIQGSYNSSGAVVANQTRIRNSGFIHVNAGDILTFTPGANAQNMLYGIFTENKVFVRDSSWHTGSSADTIEISGYIIAIFRKANNQNITPEEYDANLEVVSPLVVNITDDILETVYAGGYTNKKITVLSGTSSGIWVSIYHTSVPSIIRCDSPDVVNEYRIYTSNSKYITCKPLIPYSVKTIRGGDFTIQLFVDGLVQEGGSVVGGDVTFTFARQDSTFQPDSINGGAIFDYSISDRKLVKNAPSEIEASQTNLMARHITDLTVVPLTIMHFSDIHKDVQALDRITEYAENLGETVNDIICTGDMCENTSEQISSWWNENILTCIGNHDTASYSGDAYDWTALSMADRDAYYIAPFESNWGITHVSGTSYYYKDYAAQKVRLIVMDCMLYHSGGSDATAQTAWLTNLLSDAITNNLHVLIAIHAPVNAAPVVSCSFSRINKANMVTLADAYTPAEVVTAVATAIEGGLNFVGYIVGHNHQDYIYKPDTTQIGFCITCAEVKNQNYWKGSDQYRSETDDAYNLITIDTAHKLVKVVRGGGANMDNVMRARKGICFNYSTGEMIGELG